MKERRHCSHIYGVRSVPCGCLGILMLGHRYLMIKCGGMRDELLGAERYQTVDREFELKHKKVAYSPFGCGGWKKKRFQFQDKELDRILYHRLLHFVHNRHLM